MINSPYTKFDHSSRTPANAGSIATRWSPRKERHEECLAALQL